MIKHIHQIFFRFDKRALDDYPLFVESKGAWGNMGGWTYQLWDEQTVAELCKENRPHLHGTYQSLRYPIQRVDFAKYIIADSCGGLIVDLDVLPLRHADGIIARDCEYLVDRCSRKHVVANDFFYVGSRGLPGVFDYFVDNLSRVNKIAVYEARRMRYIFHTTGPDFFTRYLKRTGLDKHRVAISDRTFPHAPKRNTYSTDPRIRVVHLLSWVKQLGLSTGQVPKLPGQEPASSRGLNAKGGADPLKEAHERGIGPHGSKQSVARHDGLSTDGAGECDASSVLSILGAACDADGPDAQTRTHADAEAIPP